MKEIEDFFTGDGGEFGANAREYPYRVIAPDENDTHVIFATKWGCLAHGLDEHGPPAGAGMVVRYGLPSRHDLSWLNSTIGDRRVLFLGDLDPTDLLIFVWLQLNLKQQFEVVGINDHFLSELQVKLPDSYRIELNEEEIRAVQLLKEVWPAAEGELGANCFSLLNSGLKIEQEAVLTRLGASTPILAFLKRAVSGLAPG